MFDQIHTTYDSCCGFNRNRKYTRTPTSIRTGNYLPTASQSRENLIRQQCKDHVTLSAPDHQQYTDLDQVTLAHNLVINNQSIYAAITAGGISSKVDGIPPEVDGILGVGPLDLTRGALSHNKNATIPTVMDNLLSQGLIKDQVLGIYFAPPTSNNDTSEYSMPDPCLPSSLRSADGALTYGGADSNLVWTWFLFHLLSARCLNGLYVSCTVRGQPHIYSSDEDKTGLQFLGHRHHFVYVRQSHRHPHFHCWDRRPRYYVYVSFSILT